MVSRGMGAEDGKARRVCEAFVGARIGLELREYRENLEDVLQAHIDTEKCDFLLTPIGPPRSKGVDEDELNLIPDLIAAPAIWEAHVAINISLAPMETYDTQEAKCFDKIFQHALYLPTPVVVIDCPDSPIARLTVASTVNERLKQTQTRPYVLFRIALKRSPRNSRQHDSSSRGPASPSSGNTHVNYNNELEELSSGLESSAENTSLSSSHNSESSFCRSWRIWNSMRQHLEPDIKIGVCLELSDTLDSDVEELAKWTGEPVRMIVLNCNQFVSTPNCTRSTRLDGRYREFLRTILIANSFMTSFILKLQPGLDMEDHFNHLKQLRGGFEVQHPDLLRGWDDVVLNPLQPLSINLDSNTYRIFETDEVKYASYKQAMVEAFDFLILRNKSMRRQYVAMVLGAGRGPLVDAMISAIKLVAGGFNFKIYALDKNHSCVRSLRYKKKNSWSKAPETIQVEVVEGDMRTWQPEEKADLIASELLGSFSDNELSPECIDGTYRFATRDTISIPQEYCSFLAPISSYRMSQEMRGLSRTDPNAFDQIYVVRLANYYTISSPQELFKFEHMDLSGAPIEGSNQRFKKLTFWSKVDTVCHGFAGFFSSKLFGTTSISTVPANKTPNMESWFPAFIPIEKPIQLAADTPLEVSFYRKESPSKVWYEWVVMHPEVTKIHSAHGVNTAMSKIFD